MEHWKLGKFDFKKCPDCGHDKFLEGPHGGLSVNFKCENCEAKFNNMGPFGIERLEYGILKSLENENQKTN